MGVSAYLLVLLCLLSVATGMARLSPPPPPELKPESKAPSQEHARSIAIVVVIGVVFFLILLCLYITQFRSRLARDGAPQAGNAAASRRGLDPAVLATFPVVLFAEIREHKIGGGPLECAVCLTAFEEADDLRLLPHCSHGFHPECIDPWLGSRTTCPLCRANLEKPPPPHAAVAITILPVRKKEEQEEDSGDDHHREEVAVELEKLRGERRAARLRRSHSTGHSLTSGRWRRMGNTGATLEVHAAAAEAREGAGRSSAGAARVPPRRACAEDGASEAASATTAPIADAADGGGRRSYRGPVGEAAARP